MRQDFPCGFTPAIRDLQSYRSGRHREWDGRAAWCPASLQLPSVAWSGSGPQRSNQSKGVESLCV